MKRDYNRDLFKHLEEMYARFDKIERELEEERRKREEYEEENKRLKQALMERDAKIESLEDEIVRLKRIINNDSSNSSLPPSQDGPEKKAANRYNGREKSGRAVGGQRGHRGKALRREAAEQLIANGSKHTIVCHGKPDGNKNAKYRVQYEIELQCEAEVIEHRYYEGSELKNKSIVYYGKKLQALIVMLYIHGVQSYERIAEFISSVSHAMISIATSTVYSICRRFAGKCKEEATKIAEALRNAEIIRTDATNVSVGGKTGYLRNVSTETAVLYSYSGTKTKEALGENAVLGSFKGIMVHDHETAMYSFGSAHAECNVHILRYLKKNSEESGHKWSEEMGAFLKKMLRVRQETEREGRSFFSKAEIAEYEAEYDRILQRGKNEGKKGLSKTTYCEEKALFNRLEKYKVNHLLFLHDFRIPFENNLSERDLRKCKTRQKISGCFRTEAGAKNYCTALSVLETAKRSHADPFHIIRCILVGE